MKRVLVVAQVIPQWYIDLITNALEDNCRIDIITGSKDVKGNLIHSPEYDPHSFKSRLVCWFKHYRFMNQWMRENRKEKYDLILAISNPPINSFIGLKLKQVLNAPFVYMNWDLYPQIIEAKIGNPIVQMICKFWYNWNNRHYPQIDAMLTIGDVMAESMKASMKNCIEVSVMPVAVDTDRLNYIERKSNVFAVQNALTDKFVILYSGKMGDGHNIEIILQAAEKLKEKKDIEFVFIGHGPKFDLIKDYIAEHALDNCQLHGLQSEEMFPQSISCGNIGIVTQEAKMAHLFVPSRVYSMMACKEAIIGICTEHDDLSKLIYENKIGECIPNNNDSELLENTILRLYYDRETLKIYGENARNLVERKYSLTVVEEKYRQLFDSLIS